MPGQTPRFTSWVAFEMHCVGIDASVCPCLYAARRLCPPTVAVHECAVIAKAQGIVCPMTRAGILFDSWFWLFAIIWEIPGARLPPGIDTAPFWNRFGLGSGNWEEGRSGVRFRSCFSVYWHDVFSSFFCMQLSRCFWFLT